MKDVFLVKHVSPYMVKKTFKYIPSVLSKTKILFLTYKLKICSFRMHFEICCHSKSFPASCTWLPNNCALYSFQYSISSLFLHLLVVVVVVGVNQAYSRLSTTHGHITDCKFDSVVCAGVCVVI